MDMSEAIKHIKKAVDEEIPHLKQLKYDNQEDYYLWHSKMQNILEASFGKASDKYIEFCRIARFIEFSRNFSIQKNFKQNLYLDNLTKLEMVLKSIIQKYEMLGIEEKSALEKLVTQDKPKAFIVHGGKSGVLEKLREFIEALGIKPLIVEMLPSKGMTLADKIKKYQQEADCAIILATHGGIIDTKSGKQHPRLNVIDELSSLWEAFPERVIVLLEKGAELPSNKSGLTYEPFARQSMDRAFIAIARELTEMKILKAVKPSQEQTL